LRTCRLSLLITLCATLFSSARRGFAQRRVISGNDARTGRTAGCFRMHSRAKLMLLATLWRRRPPFVSGAHKSRQKSVICDTVSALLQKGAGKITVHCSMASRLCGMHGDDKNETVSIIPIFKLRWSSTPVSIVRCRTLKYTHACNTCYI